MVKRQQRKARKERLGGPGEEEKAPREGRLKSMVLHSGWWRWVENKAWDRVGRKEKRSTEGLRGSLTCFRFPLPTLVRFGCPLFMSCDQIPWEPGLSQKSCWP